MSIPDADETARPAPTEHPAAATPPAVVAEPAAVAPSAVEPEAGPRDVVLEPPATLPPTAVMARPANPQEREVLFVPLAVTIGDGFKFGCGFFLALVLVMLVGFVLVAALFVLTSLFGVSLPLAR